jgi:hypothetical protein
LHGRRAEFAGPIKYRVPSMPVSIDDLHKSSISTGMDNKNFACNFAGLSDADGVAAFMSRAMVSVNGIICMLLSRC